MLELVHHSAFWFPADASDRSGLARRLDGLPDPLRRRRHVEMSNAVGRQRVDHRAHHRGRRGDRTDLAATLDADRIVRATGALRRYRYHRQVICTRHAVIHKRAGEQLSAGRIIDAVLAERLARALHDATMDLTLDDHRVQHDADVVDGGVCDESQLTGVRIDLDLGDMTAAGEGEIHRIEEGGLFEAGLQDVEWKAVRGEICSTGDLAECHATVGAAHARLLRLLPDPACAHK